MITRHTLPLLALLAGTTLTAQAQVTAERSTLGQSSSGAPIEIWTIADQSPDELGRAPDLRPAVLLIAGIDGSHRVGVEVARRVAEAFAGESGGALAGRTLYVIPSLNPDGAAWLNGRDGLPRMDWGRVPVSMDADGDRRADEDGADDLNGDGMITMMRVADPHPSTGLTAEYVAVEDEPRLLRRADRDEGETPVYAILTEGVDNDGDGDINEDGPGGSAGGGVNLDANFPSLWPEHREDAGDYPLVMPESRALAEWIQDHPNVTAVLLYNSNDNLLNIPKTGQYDETGRMPKGLEKDDEPEHKHVAERFKDITGMTGAVTGDNAGSVERWTYADLGLWTFETPVWTRPDQVKADGQGADEQGADGQADAQPEPPAATAEENAPEEPEVSEYDSLIARGVPEEFARFLTMSREEQAAQMAEYQNLSPEEQAETMQQVSQLPEDVRARLMALATGGEDPGKPRAAGTPDKSPKANTKGGGGDEAETAWLRYSDEERGGEGFVDWTKVEHPQLGAVEVGGFVPGFRTNPPEDRLDELASQQAEFLSELLAMLPDLDIGSVEVESLGGGLHRVHLTVTNTGYLPTASAMGVKARRIVPVVAAISVPLDGVIAGNRVQSVESIEGSRGTHTFEWTVRSDNAGAITVDIRTGHFGNHTATTSNEGGDS
ncbi:MAG: M14 family zinc carboxypeptidase [Phycisphaerales bacterium JB040]